MLLNLRFGPRAGATRARLSLTELVVVMCARTANPAVMALAAVTGPPIANLPHLRVRAVNAARTANPAVMALAAVTGPPIANLPHLRVRVVNAARTANPAVMALAAVTGPPIANLHQRVRVVNAARTANPAVMALAAVTGGLLPVRGPTDVGHLRVANQGASLALGAGLGGRSKNKAFTMVHL
jgi:hypothetical protein